MYSALTTLLQVANWILHVSYTAATLHMYVHWKFLLLVKRFSTWSSRPKLESSLNHLCCPALTNVSELVIIATPQSSKLFLVEDQEKIDDVSYWIVIMHEVNTSLNHIPTSLVDCTWLSLASHLFLHLQDQLDHGKNWFHSLEVKLTQSWVTKHDSCYNYNWWRVKNEQG